MGTDRQTDGQMDRRTDAGDDNNPLAEEAEGWKAGYWMDHTKQAHSSQDQNRSTFCEIYNKISISIGAMYLLKAEDVYSSKPEWCIYASVKSAITGTIKSLSVQCQAINQTNIGSLIYP